MKSNASEYLELLQHIYRDVCSKVSADVFDNRDLMTIKSRFEHEGVSFLTITLPQFAKDLERALAEGFISPTAFTGFKRQRGLSLPAFLQGLTRCVFDEKMGLLVPSDDASVIVEGIRQVCNTYKKIELDCTPERVHKSLNNYLATETELDKFDVQHDMFVEFANVSFVLWHNAFADFDLQTLIPRHGPGQTAEKKLGNEKYSWRYWHERLEPYFPLYENAYPLGMPSDARELQLVTMLSADQEIPVRVVQVPKTLKAPRIIAIEPACMQYTQQGLREYLYDKLEVYWLTTGHINFRDQMINQQLAISSSANGLLATVDLSDASDRVPRDLAMYMFHSNPNLYDSIEACRSTRAILPDGRKVDHLRKFASMGSALCFPVESMFFYTICVAALLKAYQRTCTPLNVFYVTRGLYVYGDDMVIPAAYADTVLDYLQKFNCKVNLNKSFVNGKFRESCGVDAYDGYEVTSTYIRSKRPQHRQQAEEVSSYVATANLFYKRGYWSTAQYMFAYIERILGKLPFIQEDSPGLGRISFLGKRSVERWNRDLQRFEVQAFVPTKTRRKDELDGYGALTKTLLDLERRQNGDPGRERDSLSHSGSRGVTTLTLRWVRP
jgi:hypothetical protein